MDRPLTGIDPNTEHQLWSEWRFVVVGPRRPPIQAMLANFVRWAQRFEAATHVRVQRRVHDDLLVALVEGVPAHDPDYQRNVRQAFRSFVSAGWGPLGAGELSVRVLAGDTQDGRPRAQLLALPHVLGDTHGRTHTG